MNLKKKIVAIFLVIGLIVIVLAGIFAQFEFSHLTDQQLDKTTATMKQELENALNAKEKVWLTNALQIANNSIIQEAIANNNRSRAISVLDKYSQQFKEDTGFNNVKVHLIDADLNSFVKSWAKDDFGESLDYSDAYQKVKTDRKALVTTEEAPNGLRLKGLFPITYQEEFVGIANFEGGLNSIKRTLTNNKLHFLYFLKDDYLDIAQGISDKSKINGYTLSQKDINEEFLTAVTENLNLNAALKDYQFTDNYLITAQKIESIKGEELGVYLVGQAKGEVMAGVNESKKMVYWIFAFFFVIFVGLLGVLYFFINKNITEPLTDLMVKVKEFATGNLQEEILLEQNDEIGELATELEDMRGTLRELVASVIEKTEDLSAYSEELSASSQEGNATIETTNSLVEDISSNIEEISASTEEVTSFAQESSSKTEVGADNIEETLNSIEGINQATTEALEIIGQLEDTSQEIDKIVEMITNIAEQTNLLALNAAIEAARAGEAGQGFAVVAEEIRELAEETNQATEEISHLINETQNKTNSGLEAVEEVKEKAVNSEEVAQETKEIFSDIRESSEQTSTQLEQIATSTQNLAQKSEEVRSSTAEIENMSSEVTHSSQELAEMAQELQGLIEEFEV